MPLMFLEGRGFAGVWAGLALNVGALAVCGAVLILRPVTLAEFLGGRLLIGSFLFGLAITLYASSILATDVARALLFFYISPAWSTIIEMLFMGRRATGRRVAALVLSAAGLWILTGGSFQDGLTVNSGDVMALLSGLAWAVGSALLFSSKGLKLRVGCFHSFLSAVVTGLFVALLLPGAGELSADAASWALALLFGAAYMLPVAVICLWGALILPPGTLGFLLTGEIVSGLLSSVLLLDQPFGWSEGMGALLISAAAASEALAGNRTKTAPVTKRS